MHTNTQTHRRTDTQTDTHTDRHTHRQPRFSGPRRSQYIQSMKMTECKNGVVLGEGLLCHRDDRAHLVQRVVPLSALVNRLRSVVQMQVYFDSFSNLFLGIVFVT